MPILFFFLQKFIEIVSRSLASPPKAYMNAFKAEYLDDAEFKDKECIVPLPLPVVLCAKYTLYLQTKQVPVPAISAMFWQTS